MRKLYFLVFLVFASYASGQIINIPDTNFKAKLLSANSSNQIASTETPASGGIVNTYNVIDSNGDGEIQVSEAQSIKWLNINNSNLTNLSGIEMFTNLQYLSCDNNQITNLSLSSLTNLIWFYCGSNQLTSLDVSGLTSLQMFDCNFNQLGNIDVSGLVNLEYFECRNNQLLSLDVSSSSNLNWLGCEFNQLSYLNLKNGNSGWFLLDFTVGNPNLNFVCSDVEDIQEVQQQISASGLVCHVSDYCSFTPGGTYYEIYGSIKCDFNENGCDVNDTPYPNLNFNITNTTNSGTFIANTSGEYFIPVPAGSHTITPNFQNTSAYISTPASLTVNFPTQSSPFLQEFCITANGVHDDVEIILVPIVSARPGFDAHYKLVYKNVGNQVENGTVLFDYDDSVLDFVSNSVSYNSQTSSANNTISLLWNYTNLQPLETREIDVILNVNSPTETPAVNIGDILGLFAQITTINTDENLSNNSSSLRQVVVGSYDPNDKTCIEGETISPNMVAEYVHYVIRFENTGTYPAENIVVRDVINSTQFDISTLVPLSGSHEFYTRINDNVVEFIFEDINLDFNNATNDGYVAFKIKTLPTLTLGDSFSNQANIYFDYNFPITTNNFTTTITALSQQDFEFDSEFSLFPNPVANTLNIKRHNQAQINSIEIYNTLGQLILVLTDLIDSLDVSQLNAGNYFIKLNTDKGSVSTKFIKE
jgi:hypothetical protein